MFRGIELEPERTGSSASIGEGASPVGVKIPPPAEEAMTYASKERRDMKKIVLLVGLGVAFVGSGCMTGYYAHRDGDIRAEQDSLMPPPMTIDDVIALAKDSVADDVIISQIRATDSYFRLTTDDILALKKAGVSQRVISVMIQTSQKPQPVRRTRVYSPLYYPYWGAFWYPDPWYYWYPSIYIGYSHIGGYYGGHFPVGHRSAGGRR
jgi:hypothetical protein